MSLSYLVEAIWYNLIRFCSRKLFRAELQPLKCWIGLLRSRAGCELTLQTRWSFEENIEHGVFHLRCTKISLHLACTDRGMPWLYTFSLWAEDLLRLLWSAVGRCIDRGRFRDPPLSQVVKHSNNPVSSWLSSRLSCSLCVIKNQSCRDQFSSKIANMLGWRVADVLSLNPKPLFDILWEEYLLYLGNEIFLSPNFHQDATGLRCPINNLPTMQELRPQPSRSPTNTPGSNWACVSLWADFTRCKLCAIRAPMTLFWRFWWSGHPRLTMFRIGQQ